MRVILDADRCEANGICERLAAQVFRLDEHDRLHVLIEEPPPELIASVREAIRRCPKQALRLTDR